jgi:hypothetical protein
MRHCNPTPCAKEPKAMESPAYKMLMVKREAKIKEEKAAQAKLYALKVKQQMKQASDAAVLAKAAKKAKQLKLYELTHDPKVRWLEKSIQTIERAVAEGNFDEAGELTKLKKDLVDAKKVQSKGAVLEVSLSKDIHQIQTEIAAGNYERAGELPELSSELADAKSAIQLVEAAPSFKAGKMAAKNKDDVEMMKLMDEASQMREQIARRVALIAVLSNKPKQAPKKNKVRMLRKQTTDDDRKGN